MEARADNKFLNSVSSIFENLEDIELPISIFKVPNSLSVAKPEAYIPHLLGLGPYHHLRPELQQMQMCKLNEAKRIHEGFQSIGFGQLAHLLSALAGPAIRACYSMYLDMDDEALTTIMAIDSLFLFELLCFYGISREELIKLPFFDELVNSKGRRLVQDMTCLRESMMLENQIPILVLKILMLVQFSQESEFGMACEVMNNLFPQMLMTYCKAVSPLKLLEKYPNCKALKSAHLLDLLYTLTVLKEAPSLESGEEELEQKLLESISKQVGSLRSDSVETPRPISIQPLKQSIILAKAIEIAGEVPQIGQRVQLVTGLLKLPWTELWTSISTADSPPDEEIFIPRASKLHRSGIKFILVDHITDIKFDSKSVSFHLPLIRLSGNSEVVIRNLVAYEALIKPDYEQLIFTRYMEIMSGILRTVEDVKVLKEKGILEFESIKDVEVVEVFTGMRRSVRLTNAVDLDRAIEEVNKYYNGLWKVSARKALKRWWRRSWSLFKVFAILVLFAILLLHTFCTVYGCTRFFSRK